MKLEHIALWTYQLEQLKEFYVGFFEANLDAHYRNENKNFESYFLSFKGGARLELMTMPDIPADTSTPQAQRTGLIHMAFDVGSPEAVDALTQKVEDAGYEVLGRPRTTGDGYYESVVLDPDQNMIEIACNPSEKNSN